MKRILAILLAALLVLSAAAVAEGRTALEVKDYLAEQAMIDSFLIAEAEAGYSFEEPLVVLNPYGNAPLSAVAIFSTEEEIGGTITAKGKAAEDDVSGTFPAAKTHFVPVYGLYAGGITDVVITLDDGRSTTVQVETEPVSLNGSGFEAVMYQPENYDFSKLTVSSLVRDRAYAAFDSKGDLRWLLNDCVSAGRILLENGRMILPTSYSYTSAVWWSNGVREIDGMGKVYREFIFPGGQHHDYLEMPDGNYLIVSDTPGEIDSEDYMLVLNPTTGEVVWDLDLDTIIDRTDGGSLSRTDWDWAHINGVCYDAENDLMIISCRHLDAVVAIRMETKEIAWILGNPEGWENTDPSLFLTPIGEDFEWQYAQHNINLLSDGTLLLYDNGTAGRAKATNADQALAAADNYSRVVNYKVDAENMTVEQLWQYGKEWGSETFSLAMCGIDILDEESRHYLVAHSLCNAAFDPDIENGAGFRTQLHMIKDGEMVWEMSYQLNGLLGTSYRAYRTDLYEAAAGYDVYAQYESYGDMGRMAQLDTTADLANPAAMPDTASVSAYAFQAFRVSGNYIEAAEMTGEYAVVLVDADGMQTAFDLHNFSSDVEGGKLVTLDAWISTVGLDAGEYAVYLVMNGSAYDTGVSVAV
ncbi:MAG: aryl-sulfate sulfotransferase [Clostridia bacterium]|nr:aryl-sulfate sulfotransferase [Clostridia bacterium]